MARSTEVAYVDSIECKTARLLIGGEGLEIFVPSRILPSGTEEGEWLTLTFEKCDDIREREESEISGLLRELCEDNGDGDNISEEQK